MLFQQMVLEYILVYVYWNTSLSPRDMLITSRRRFNSTIFREEVITIATFGQFDIIEEMLSSSLVHQFLLVEGNQPSKTNLTSFCTGR
jgi:hypothetical protein